MRIVIDLQPVQTSSRFRGTGRYSLSLALALARNAGDHEIWLVLSAAFPESIPIIRYAFERLIPPERIRIFDVPTPCAGACPADTWRVRAAEKIREHFLLQLEPDVVHVASLFEGMYENAVTSVGKFIRKGDTAATLYDLTPMVYESVYLPNQICKDWYYGKLSSLKNVDLLLAISDYSRSEAIKMLQFPADRVVNISAAVDVRFHPVILTEERIQQLRSRYGIQRKIVMYTPGGFDWHKNYDGLIRAYALLPSELRANHQLVIVGNINDKQIENLQYLRKRAGLLKEELVLTDYVPDDVLVTLYNLASLFVFPSKYEGFGLSVLEAMACGTPTIGSNAASIPEIIGLDEALFNPNSDQSIANKMAQVLRSSSLAERLSAHGLRQAKKFSWDTNAKTTIQVFESLTRKNDLKRSNAYVFPDQTTYSQLLESMAQIHTLGGPSDSDLALAARSVAFNTAETVPRQLLLDVQCFVPYDNRTGIPRVARCITTELLKESPQGYVVRPIYSDGQQYRYAQKFMAQLSDKLEIGNVGEFVEFNQDDIFLSFSHETYPLHRYLHCIGVRMYFVVHDILFTKRPDWFSADNVVTLKEWLDNISQVATGLVCISKTVAGEVCEWLNCNPPVRSAALPINSFHLGADIEKNLPTKGIPNDATKVLRLISAKPSFLMVSILWARKGHLQTLAAFEKLWAQGVDVNLVIVGRRGWGMEVLFHKLQQHAQLGKRLFWLEDISDEYLEKVYAASSCLIAASEGEGFGLPLIEAARYKLPVIARDLSIFREVAGEHAFYFSGIQPQALADAVNQWLELNAEGKAPQSVDMPWLTWQQSAQQLLKVIGLSIEVSP